MLDYITKGVFALYRNAIIKRRVANICKKIIKCTFAGLQVIGRRCHMWWFRQSVFGNALVNWHVSNAYIRHESRIQFDVLFRFQQAISSRQLVQLCTLLFSCRFLSLLLRDRCILSEFFFLWKGKRQ